MTTPQLLNWLLLNTLTLGALWLLYHLALRRERCFQYNRALLLMAPPLAALLPLVHLPAAWLPATPTAQAPLRLLLPTVTVGASATSAPVVPLLFWVLLLYGAGVALLLGRLSWQLLLLWRFTRTLPAEQNAEYTLYRTGGQRPTGSFGRAVYWDDTLPLSTAEAAHVLRHELVHVRQHHTLDRLWLRVWQAVLWPNLFVHLLPRALDLTHEYLADAAVAPTAPTDYIRLLARQATGWLAPAPTLAHSFFSSSTLTRIAMLNRSSSVPRRWKQWLALPVCAGSLVMVAYAKNTVAGEATVRTMYPNHQAQASMPAPPLPPALYTAVDQMPQPVGGMDQLLKYFTQNIRYPEAAKAQHLEGKVLVSFIVTTNGSVQAVKIHEGIEKDLDAKATLNKLVVVGYTATNAKPGTVNASSGARQAMNEEALRMVRAMPQQWKPGQQNGKPVAVLLTLPIVYVLR
ncbi:TonB family protein [Hymenobacter defluvii]|uniref:TonB family protein n=1 Tax=Hymenobacter defluvii TaxID=2054411 RepID=A0ABS3TBV0_9BACT|nr:M56 family metallopeptidase [Hymenobacter defluvii]MBO3271132.1 TonB family protein [Hymenobacter defluvii]